MAQLLKKERLDLYGNLAKAESSLAVQIRTEKIGFAQFLHRLRVPAVTSPSCDCGWHSQTTKHIVWYCNLRPHRQRMLEEAGTTDYTKAVSTPKGLRVSGHFVVDDTGFTVAIFTGYRSVVSMIKVFFAGTKHARG